MAIDDVTLGDYYTTGQQDCRNVIEPSEFDRFDPVGSVDRVFEEWEIEGLKEEWVKQNEDDVIGNGLDVDQAYAAWRDGWRDTARSILAHRRNPAGLTQKGERMYKHVLASVRLRAQAQDKGAKRYASATVLGAAKRGVPGLVRKNAAEEAVPGTDQERRALLRASVRRRIANRMEGVTTKGADIVPSWRTVEVRGNPEINREDADAAVDKYKEFHRYDPRRLEEIGGLEIPRRVRKLGAAAHVLYRSAKVDPATLKKPKRPVDYIHEHDAGVVAYAVDGTPDTDVPRSIYEATAVVALGKCLGFKLKDGKTAEGTEPLPDLCCTPDGKCLLVIQGKTKVIAMMWGGALGVFARGIDG